MGGLITCQHDANVQYRLLGVKDFLRHPQTMSLSWMICRILRPQPVCMVTSNRMCVLEEKIGVSQPLTFFFLLN